MGFDPSGDLDAKTVRSRTDVQFQSFSLYLEGVQIPFMSISLNSSLGNPPRMSVQIPSQTGLMDICRFYEPKIHLFFTDPITGKDCVLFSGIVTATSYSKSSATPPRKYISFTCEHRYSQLNMVTLDYSGYASDSNASLTETNLPNAAVKVNLFNSLQSIGMALTGVNPAKSSSEEINLKNVLAKKEKGEAYPYNAIPEYLSDLKNRFTGFPGVPLNLWNQLKAQTYENHLMYEGMTRMYIPLVEEGLQLFRRIGGHYLLEEKLNNTKVSPCTESSTGENALETEPRLVPPHHKQFLLSAIQADISTQIVYTAGQFSGEFTSFLSVLQNLMYAIEYDLVFLTSPAEVPKDPSSLVEGADTEAVDILVKPQMPHYYAPACNVVLPYMIDSVSITQDESVVPTRITAINDNVPGQTGQFGVNYRAPQSIREAVARGIAELDDTTASRYSSLARTTAASQFKIGRYEQGRGIRHQSIQMPKWLAMMAETLSQESPSSSEAFPEEESEDGLEVEKHRKAWHFRYDPEEKMKQLNPWDPASELNAFQRLLFSAADYKFTTEVAKSRTGTVSMIFNPYIVPGYPMDIIDPTPTEPSFHAFCIEVNHIITASSVGTSVSFVSAMTYQELGNYEQMYTTPWLQSALKTLAEETDGEKTIYRSSIVNNVSAREAAAQFYLSALGVGAAPPELLYDFSTGTPYPYSKIKGSIFPVSPEGVDAHVSGEGNLYLAYRPIETKEQVEERFGVKFIDMTPDNYDPEVFSHEEPILDESKLLEPGQSMFLDYAEIPAPSRDEVNSADG